MEEDKRAFRHSQSQILTMLSFMESYGDLSRPINKAMGHATQEEKWMELAELLNSEGNGVSKTVVQWKKVWADLKYRTKNKAGKLKKSMSSTGGGTCKGFLNDVEERILAIMGLVSVVGTEEVPEPGLMTLGLGNAESSSFPQFEESPCSPSMFIIDDIEDMPTPSKRTKIDKTNFTENINTPLTSPSRRCKNLFAQKNKPAQRSVKDGRVKSSISEFNSNLEKFNALEERKMASAERVIQKKMEFYDSMIDMAGFVKESISKLLAHISK